MKTIIPAACLAAAGLLTGCGAAATEPLHAAQDAPVVEAPGSQDWGLDARRGQGVLVGGPLQPLLRRALAAVRESQGPEAAERLLAELRERVAEGRDLRRAGDREALRGHAEATRTRTAAIIVEALGAEVVDSTLARAAASLTGMQERLEGRSSAGGGAAERQAEMLARLGARYQEAADARAAGDLVTALEKAAPLVRSGERVRELHRWRQPPSGRGGWGGGGDGRRGMGPRG